MDLGYSSRVVLVVGGTGFIGREVARAVAEDGATVVLAARDTARLADLARESGADTVELDTTSDESVRAAVEQVLQRHGRIDSLVVTAAPAAGTLDTARDREPAQILSAIDTKALGFLRVAEAVAPAMREAGYGRIVGVSGQNARLTASVTGALRNQALLTIAKILADSLAGTGVTVNVVNPGPVTEHDGAAAPEVGKPGASSVRQVAALIAFLGSEPAGGVSGEAIAVGHKLRGVAG